MSRVSHASAPPDEKLGDEPRGFTCLERGETRGSPRSAASAVRLARPGRPGHSATYVLRHNPCTMSISDTVVRGRVEPRWLALRLDRVLDGGGQGGDGEPAVVGPDDLAGRGDQGQPGLVLHAVAVRDA